MDGRELRYTTDSLVLAEAVDISRGPRVLELGCGNGAVCLALAMRQPKWQIVGIEINEALVNRALENVGENQLGDRVRIVQGDVRTIGEALDEGDFDTVVCNPPYYPVDEGRINPDPERAAARHELYGGLPEFLAAGKAKLASSGAIVMVYAAARLSSLLESIRRAGLAVHWLQFVHHAPDQPASLVLAEARRRNPPQMAVRPPRFVEMLMVLLLFATSCSTPSATASIDPMTNAIEQSAELLQQAVHRGHEVCAELDAVRFSLRYNPAECDCPAWEIVYHGRWTRVYLQSGTETDRLLNNLAEQARLDHESSLYEVYETVGHLGPELTTAQSGMRYRTFWIISR
jgi:tRNA1Val (adenine37-N6)-methyltransferase